MAADFTYLTDGLLFTIFPENPQAEETVSKLLESTGSNKLLKFEFDAFRKQARAAGYTVRKARKINGPSAADLAELLSAYGVEAQ